MVLASSGLVLTNNHVIAGATSIQVVDPATRRRYAATVVGYDVADDVAVLRLKGASALQSVDTGDSAGLKRGATVRAVGNAGGAGGKPAVATGTIRALNRTITVSDDNGNTRRLSGLIETDAALEPGDSGGPLLNAAGKVIGMDTAGTVGVAFQPSGSDGFAIPINRALSITSQILAGRASARVHVGPTAFIGIDVQTAHSFDGRALGLLVTGVVSSSPAQRAGLAAGDVITALDGHAIRQPRALAKRVFADSPGSKIRLGWLDRFGNRRSATLTLASGPPQ